MPIPFEKHDSHAAEACGSEIRAVQRLQAADRSAREIVRTKLFDSGTNGERTVSDHYKEGDAVRPEGKS